VTTQKVVIPEGVEIMVTETPSRGAKHRIGAMFGPLLSTQRYILHDNNLINVTRALLERVFRVRGVDGKLEAPPKPDEGLFAKILSPEALKLTSGPKLKPWSIKDVLPLWSGPKYRTYVTAFNSLVVEPLTRRDGYLKCFVKCEKISSAKKDPVPRVIQPRSARYNLNLARFLKPHEKEYYRRIDRMFDTDGKGDKTVFKGLDAKGVADHMLLKASRYSNPVFVGLDASRFDQHVSEQALRWEHSIYLNTMAYDTKELARLLEWQIDNVGFGYFPEGKVKYKVRGRRMSGDMNTSLGNCMLMSCMVHAYMRLKRIPCSLANNGDDCVLIFERSRLKEISDLSEWFLKMGFKMVREKALYDIRQVSFCQLNVISSPGYNISVRDPNVVVSKDLHSTYPFQRPNDYTQWLSSVGTCGLMSSQGVPVLEQFYKAFPTDVITNKSIQLEMDREIEYCHVGGSRNMEITDEMRHSFWVAFGILPESQIELEEMYKGVRFTGSLGQVDHVPYVSLLQSNIEIDSS